MGTASRATSSGCMLLQEVKEGERGLCKYEGHAIYSKVEGFIKD